MFSFFANRCDGDVGSGRFIGCSPESKNRNAEQKTRKKILLGTDIKKRENTRAREQEIKRYAPLIQRKTQTKKKTSKRFTVGSRPESFRRHPSASRHLLQSMNTPCPSDYGFLHGSIYSMQMEPDRCGTEQGTATHG